MPETHASVELIEAMLGVPPVNKWNRRAGVEDALRSVCSASDTGAVIACSWSCDDSDREVTCPKCRALYPEAIKVRLDYLEENGLLKANG